MSSEGISLSELLEESLRRTLKEALRLAVSRSATRGLRRIIDALRESGLDGALRHADRAWRCQPEDAITFAPIYGGLLSLHAHDYNAALGILRQAADLSPDPDVAALIILQLLRLQRPEAARDEFEIALGTYCIEPEGLLARIGGEVLRHCLDFPGWVGRGSALDLIGELRLAETPRVLSIAPDGEPPLPQLLPPVGNDGHGRFLISAPHADRGGALVVSHHARRLLGSGLRPRADYSLDGRTNNQGRRISGWARLGWCPSKPLRLRIDDENGRRHEISTRRVPQAGRRWPFHLDLRTAQLTGTHIRVSAQLPDGRWQMFPDAPHLLETALRGAQDAPAPRRRRITRAGGTDVIIPVYGNAEASLAAIRSVLATLDDRSQLVVVDDASQDPALCAALDGLAADGSIELLRNPKNLGFVGSANRGLSLNARHDVVLLNSDTLVFDDWLPRLRNAAYSAPNVGTVTPLSNNGSIASYPRQEGGAIATESAGALHSLAGSTLGDARFEIPVGIGHCLYLRRDCLRDVGTFDAAVFGAGYGEESDFCMRARRRGWSHQLAADVFVYHAGGGSFGNRRQALLDRGHRLINIRHKGYDRFIAGWLAQDPLSSARRQLDERRLTAFEGRFVLIVTLTLRGGVDRFVNERRHTLSQQGLSSLLLRPSSAGKPDRCELWTDAIEVPNLQYDVPGDLTALMSMLGRLQLHAIEMQHFMHIDPRVIEAVRALPIPYDVFVHDYSWICPRVTLIDGSGRYCGEPPVTACQACVRRNGSNLGEKISVPALRARSVRWLCGAQRVSVPSLDTAVRLQRHFRELAVEVHPHSTVIVPPWMPPGNARRRVVRIALIGAIGTHKGYAVLLACARDARARKLPIEFVVIGRTENDAALLATKKVFITGSYTEAEAPHLLQREQPDIAWLPSVVPETWCYALDYALRAGLPVAAFDLGAIAERVRSAGFGDLMPLSTKPHRINDRLLALHKNSSGDSNKSMMSRSRDEDTMLSEQTDGKHMTTASNGKRSQEVKDEGLSASVQVLPLQPGLYLFSVKSAVSVAAVGGSQLTLPAMHVGLGPGVRSDQVEFIAGPSTHGAWLFTAGDLLVTKISGTGATLILTSVRAPGGEVLSIKVERLEERIDTESSAAVPASPKATSAAPSLGLPSAKGQEKSVFRGAVSDLPLPVNISAHIRTRGDMTFSNVPWAGRVAPGLWIESFSVRPLERFGAADIEYKGLTGSGFETPWMSDDKMCGTKGMATPLVGFAIRLKPSPAAAEYDCDYSGYFQSGLTIGPLRNGAPCRSSVANDSLEGLQVRLVRRVSTKLMEAARGASPTPADEIKPVVKLPVAVRPATTKKSATLKRSAPAKKAAGLKKSAAVKKSSGARRVIGNNGRFARHQNVRRP